MKKFISIFIVATLVLGVIPISAAAQGSSGELLADDVYSSPVYYESEETPSEPDEENGESAEDEEVVPPPEKHYYSLNTDEHIVYISGSGSMFRPEDGLTRGEAAKIVYSLLSEKTVPEAGKFTDVPESEWYAEYVNTLAEMEIISGYGDEFHPNDNVTRAEFVTMFSHFFEPEEANVSFSDITDDFWGIEAIKTGVAKGWISGYQDGTFLPNAHITRAEAVSIVNRVLGRSADKQRLIDDGEALLFLDLPFDHWAYYEVMEAAISHSYIKDESGVETWESYGLSQTEYEPGYHYIDGELYCVSTNGYFVRNETLGVLRFDNNGRYTSGNSELDQKIKEIVKTQTAGSEGRYDSLYRLYRYVCTHFSYRERSYVAAGSSGWEPDWALQMINTGRGNCYSYAAVFAMFARQMGYQASGMSGQVHQTYQWVSHGWTQVELDGQTYLCDTEMEGIFAANRNYNWDLFMKAYGTTPTKYSLPNSYLG